MSPVAWMVGVSVVAAGMAWLLGAPGPEVFWGMAGPVTSASLSWVLVARTFQISPERVTNVMVKALAGKMVFFGAYVVAMLRGLNLAATPFAVTFTAGFIGLYVMEALFLQRLFVGTR